MKAVVFILLTVLFSLVCSTGTFVRFVVDDYQEGFQSLKIEIPTSPQFPVVDTDVFTDTSSTANLLGGERDLLLAAESGSAGRLLTALVSVDNNNIGSWTVSTPNGASGYAYIQYDGKDGDAINVANTGLGGIDFTDTGLGEAFVCTIKTDVPTQYTFTVSTGTSGSCSRTEDIPGSEAEANYYLTYAGFTGNCDFTNVGAIQVLVEQFDNVDSFITFFAAVGQPDPVTPSPTPTRSPGSSASATPSPAIPEMCECLCPTFRCGVVFKVPDDDDDTVDDDNHDDDDIVYRAVYYGPVDDDFDAITGDDDEDEFISFEGALGTSGIHDDDDLIDYSSKNSSTTLTISLSLLISLVLALVM